MSVDKSESVFYQEISSLLTFPAGRRVCPSAASWPGRARPFATSSWPRWPGGRRPRGRCGRAATSARAASGATASGSASWPLARSFNRSLASLADDEHARYGTEVGSCDVSLLECCYSEVNVQFLFGSTPETFRTFLQKSGNSARSTGPATR